MSIRNNLSREKEGRQKIIIDFIKSHPFCNVEGLVRGVENEISRVTVFKLLRELIESGAVKRHLENNQKRNARDHKLVVDESNPLVSVPLELDQFESAYFDFFNKEIIEFQQRFEVVIKTRDNKLSSAHIEHGSKLLHSLLDVFYSMVDVFLLRFLFIWSQKISDRHVLQQLHSLIFSRIADMQSRISESFRPSSIRTLHDMIIMVYIRERFRGLPFDPGPIERYLETFKKLGKEKEIEPVIDSLWRIIGDFQQYIYPEPLTQRWPFKYGKDDWRKLVTLLRQHRKSTPSYGAGRLGARRG